MTGIDIKDFLCLSRKSPLKSKLVPEKNLLVPIKILYISKLPIFTVIVRVNAATFSPHFMSKSRGASYMCAFHACSRTSPLSTLLVPVHFLTCTGQ